MQTRGAQMSARDWRRIRTLLLLDKGLTVTALAAAVGSYRRETADPKVVQQREVIAQPAQLKGAAPAEQGHQGHGQVVTLSSLEA